MTTTPKSEFERELEHLKRIGNGEILTALGAAERNYLRKLIERYVQSCTKIDRLEAEKQEIMGTLEESHKLNKTLERENSHLESLRREEQLIRQEAQEENKRLTVLLEASASIQGLKENSQLRELLQELRDALIIKIDPDDSHELIAKADEKLKRLRGE